jgi:hypothetical protein
VRFGDGSRRYQRRTFVHSYRRAGTYKLRRIAIANATVYRFSLHVRVIRRGGAVSTATTVPHDAPHHYHFPQPAPVVWPLPIWDAALSSPSGDKFRSGDALRHPQILVSWLLIDGVVLRATLGLGSTVAKGPERGARGAVSVPDDVVHRRADRGGL